MSLADMFSLGGRVALVTGASKGLGLAFASDISNYMTGSVVLIDGGYMLW